MSSSTNTDTSASSNAEQVYFYVEHSKFQWSSSPGLFGEKVTGHAEDTADFQIVDKPPAGIASWLKTNPLRWGSADPIVRDRLKEWLQSRFLRDGSEADQYAIFKYTFSNAGKVHDGDEGCSHVYLSKPVLRGNGTTTCSPTDLDTMIGVLLDALKVDPLVEFELQKRRRRAPSDVEWKPEPQTPKPKKPGHQGRSFRCTQHDIYASEEGSGLLHLPDEIIRLTVTDEPSQIVDWVGGHYPLSINQEAFKTGHWEHFEREYSDADECGFHLNASDGPSSAANPV